MTSYHGALFWIIMALGGAAAALFALRHLRRARRLSRIDTLPFPIEYESILASTPHFPHLSALDQEALRRRILRFIHTKEFIGIGIDVDDEMRVLIAFYASLLLIRKNAPLPYPHLSTILIYPDSVIIEQNRDRGGIITNEEDRRQRWCGRGRRLEEQRGAPDGPRFTGGRVRSARLQRGRQDHRRRAQAQRGADHGELSGLRFSQRIDARVCVRAVRAH
jgi:hypothetical protein